MTAVPKMAVIGLNSLESLALRRVAADDCGMRVDSFGSFAEFAPLQDSFDLFVTDSDTVIAYLDFFLPRKPRVGVVCHASGNASISSGNASLSSGFASSSSGFTLIGRDIDETRLCSVLKDLGATLTEPDSDHGDLSPREVEVLKEIATGKTNKEIADTLCISVNTVITHRKNISVKLGIRSASAMSLYALMNGII